MDDILIKHSLVSIQQKSCEGRNVLSVDRKKKSVSIIDLNMFNFFGLCKPKRNWLGIFARGSFGIYVCTHRNMTISFFFSPLNVFAGYVTTIIELQNETDAILSKELFKGNFRT